MENHTTSKCVRGLMFRQNDKDKSYIFNCVLCILYERIIDYSMRKRLLHLLMKEIPMQISYYCYQKISPDNREYLLSMPEQMKFVCDGITLHVAHSSEEFIMDCEHREWSTAKVAARYKDRWLMQSAFRADIHQLHGKRHMNCGKNHR